MAELLDLPWILMDTREQKGFTFRASAKLAGVKEAKLDFGDYAVEGMLDLIVIERKQSVSELCGNLGKNRERFERELQRMQVCKFRYIVIEDYWSSINKPAFSRMNPNSIFSSIIGLQLKYGVFFIFAGNHLMAHRITRELLIKAYFYRKLGVI